MLSRIDPRWFVISNNGLVILFGFIFYTIQRSPLQIVLAFLAALIAEFILSKGFFKKTDFWQDRALSAVVSALSVVIMLRSQHWWFHAFVVSIAILSKYTLRIDQNRHAFNPTNFAIIFSYAFLSEEYLSFYPDEFSLSLLPILTTLSFGLLGTVAARRWLIPLVYFGSVTAIAFVLERMGLANMLQILGPELGVTNLIFVFFMVTDPRSTPSRPAGLMIFTFFVALLSIILRIHETLGANFFSLFILCFIRAVLIGVQNYAKSGFFTSRFSH